MSALSEKMVWRINGNKGENRINVVIYIRYSSDNQREESIGGQLRECKEYADRNGMAVGGSYIDSAHYKQLRKKNDVKVVSA